MKKNLKKSSVQVQATSHGFKAFPCSKLFQEKTSSALLLVSWVFGFPGNFPYFKNRLLVETQSDFSVDIINKVLIKDRETFEVRIGD